METKAFLRELKKEIEILFAIKMNTPFGIDLEEFFRNKTPYHLDEWDNQEPANMVVALGDNPRTGQRERFLEHIPLARIRPKDNRSILVFDVELAFRPYVSPISGGIAYSVKNDERNALIHNSTKWTLKEVHIGQIANIGEFVGVVLHNSAGFIYNQWYAISECPPLFYGWYPEKWLDIDPKYLKLHKETIKLAQISPQYEICDTSLCCVRYGCEVANCESVVPCGTSCHKKNRCINYSDEYEILLQKWLVIQQQANEELIKKIAKPLPVLHNRVIVDAFKKFSAANYTKANESFWEAWTRVVAAQQSDFQFITDWKLQKSKDSSFDKAVKEFKKAERKWREISKSLFEAKH